MEGENKLIIVLLIIIVLLSAVALIVTQTGLTFNKDGGDNLTMNRTNTTFNRTVNDASNDTAYTYDTGITNPDSNGYTGYSGYSSYNGGYSSSQSYYGQSSYDSTPTQEPASEPGEGGSDAQGESSSLE